MEQQKIGKFIANCRKEKGLTQQQLADKLNVTYKTISRWENGNYMPDLSLIQQLSKELNVSINELLSGEKIKQEEYQEKLEENIINVVHNSKKQMTEVRIFTAILSTLFSIFILMASLIAFQKDESGNILIIGSLAMISCGIVSFLDDSKKNLLRNLIIMIIIFIFLFISMTVLRNNI